MTGKSQPIPWATTLVCPWCGAGNNRHEDVLADGNVPSVGDASICWGCKGVGVFEVDRIRRPTEEELEWMVQQQSVVHANRAVSMGVANPVDAVEATRRMFREQQT